MTNSNRAERPGRFVADIGGTNGRFAIASGGALSQRREYRNAEFADLASLVSAYLRDANIDVRQASWAACLAVAAPVSHDGNAMFTNAAWRVSPRELKSQLGLADVAIINDFAAQAYGLAALGDGDIAHIAGAARAPGARVVLGPGTGLGCAAAVPERDAWTIVTSEGGHMGFTAETDADRTILDAATAKYGRVSWERVCCGAGLALVHATLAPEDRLKGVAQGDPSEVSNAARADRASKAAASVRQYSGMLGAFAGDLALVFRAGGGVYLTGGVLDHLGDAFEAAVFNERYVAKGRFSDWLATVPVFRIVADDCALRGCANYLERLQK